MERKNRAARVRAALFLYFILYVVSCLLLVAFVCLLYYYERVT